MKIIDIVGHRRDAPRIEPLICGIERHSEIDPILVRRSRHYARALSGIFSCQWACPPRRLHSNGSATKSPR